MLYLFKSIVWTFLAADNWWNALLLQVTGIPRRIAIRGSNINEVMDLQTYGMLRTILMQGYRPMLSGYCHGISIQYNGYVIFGDYDLILILYQVMNEYGQRLDYKGKTVLDIGAYCGESAVLFSKWGAKKLIIYEPVMLHRDHIEHNIKLNGIDAEIHMEGIGNKDGYVNVPYENLDSRFGLQGSKSMQIRVRNITNVIQESRAEIAKIDCQGAEKCLVGVDNSVLRLIHDYIIEYHSSEIKNLLLTKFESSGFSYIFRNTQRNGRGIMIASRK